MFKKEVTVCFTILITIFNKILGTVIVLDKGLMPLVKNSVGMQFYVDLENNDEECKLLSKFGTCLVDENNRKDCNVFDINKSSSFIMRAHSRKTITYVVPSLYQHDLVGYSDVTLDYSCNNIRNRTEFRIPFNTQASSTETTSKYLLRDYIAGVNARKCSFIDQDPLKECIPVDCDIKYLGKRFFYDTHEQKCLPETVCIGDPDKELPEVALLTASNTCRNLDQPLTSQDLYIITAGLAVTSRPAQRMNTLMVELTSNCSTISQNMNLLQDLAFGKFYPTWNNQTLDFSAYCKSALNSIATRILMMCIIILLFAFLLNRVISFFSQRPGNKSNYCEKLKDVFDNLKSKQKRDDCTERKEVRNALLREVIIRSIPLELRSSAVNICERLGEEVKMKRRYREADIGSQINLMVEEDGSSDQSESIPPTSLHNNQHRVFK